MEGKNAKAIIILVLILAVICMSLLFVRSCAGNREYRERIKQLGNTITEYSEINKRYAEQNQEFTESIGRLEQQLGEYRKRIADAERIVTELSVDTAAVQGELSGAIETVRRIKEKLQQLKAKLNIE